MEHQLILHHLEKCQQAVHLAHGDLCKTLDIVMVVVIEEDNWLGVGKTMLTNYIVEILLVIHEVVG